MAQNNQLSEILAYGVKNKKKQDEMMSAGLSAGFSPSQMEKEMASLTNSGVFESIETTTPEETRVSKISELGEDAKKTVNSLDSVDAQFQNYENLVKDLKTSGKGEVQIFGEKARLLDAARNNLTLALSEATGQGALQEADAKMIMATFPDVSSFSGGVATKTGGGYEANIKLIDQARQTFKNKSDIILGKVIGETGEPQADSKVIMKQFEDDLTAARADLEADPENEMAKRFIDDWDNDRFDMKTGKLKAVEKTEADLTEVEKRAVAQGLSVEGYNPQTEQPTAGGEGEQEKKGFGEAFGELREGVAGVDEGVETQASSLEASNVATSQIADIKLAKRLAETGANISIDGQDFFIEENENGEVIAAVEPADIEALGLKDKKPGEFVNVTVKGENFAMTVNEKGQAVLAVEDADKKLLGMPNEQKKSEFIAGLSEERQAKIKELQNTDPAQLDAEMKRLTGEEAKASAEFKRSGEQIQSGVAKGEGAIKSNRGLETFGDAAEVGTGIIEAGKEGAGTVGEAFGRAMNENQDPASTGIQVVGALGKFLGESAGALTIGAAKVALPQGAEEVIGEGATKAVNAILETPAGQKGLELAQTGGEDWERFKTEHPTEAANLEGVVGIIEGVSTVGGAGVAKSVTKKGLKTAGGVAKNVGGKVAKGAKEGFEKQAVKQGVKKAEKEAVKKGFNVPEGKIIEGEKGSELFDLIAPKKTSRVLKELTKEGRVVTDKRGKVGEAILGTKGDRVVYSDFDKKVVKTVGEAIQGAEKMDKNTLLRSMKDNIKNKAVKLKPELEKVSISPKKIEKSKKAWESLKQTQQAGLDFKVSGGKRMQEHFEGFLNKVGVIKGKKMQTADELWDLAKDYDSSTLITKNIKNATKESGERAMAQKEMWLKNRKILRESVIEALEKSNAPKDVINEFEKMHHLNVAIDNIASHGKLAKGKKGLKGIVKEAAKDRVVQGVVGTTVIGGGVASQF